MRQKSLVVILAGAALLAAGCRPDQPAKHDAQFDATANAAPASDLPASPATPSKPDTRPLLVCFGDSLTAGYGADLGSSYPDFLQADLAERGYRYRVVNEGVSGNTTKDGLERVEGVIRMKPAVVVVEFGGNDGLRGIAVRDSRSNLDAILKRLTGAGIKVVLAGITLPPDYGPDYVQQFNQTYVLLAKKYKTPTLPFLLQGVYGVPGMMQADGIHATDNGNRIVAENVLPLVTPLLHR